MRGLTIRDLSFLASLNSTFTPKSIAGLSLWLDANAGITASGADVTTWADQSGNSNNAVVNVGTPLPPTFNATGLNGKPAVMFDPGFNATLGASLQISNSITNTPFTAFIVAISTVAVGSADASYMISSGDGSTFYVEAFSDPSTLAWYTGANSYVTNAVTPNVAELFELTVNGAGSAIHMYTDGVENTNWAATSAGAGTGFSTSGTVIGSYANGSSTFTGPISEILIYNSVLSDIDRQKVEAYLKLKWSLFSPSDIAGLSYWLDATNIPGLADGDLITSWKDKSVNANNATSNGVPIYQATGLNSRPSVGFDGTGVLSSADGISTLPLSIFAVVNNTAAPDTLASIIGSNGQSVAYAYAAGVGTVMNWFNNHVDVRTDTSAYSLGTPFLWEMVNDGTNIPTLYSDGVDLSGTYTSTDTGGMGLETGTIYVGAYNVTPDFGFVGSISEILVFDSALSSADRVKIENYLTSKWGL